MCTNHQLQHTTQSQSVLCLNQLLGQFKLISVLLYSLLWIISLGNGQTWEGCRERIARDNCFKSSTDRQWRCFCLHEYPLATWHDANSVCASTYYYYHGALATDDSPYIHDILQRLVDNTSQGEVWIGARTRPLYWNWMATQENKFARPISYQGCYGVPSGVNEENHEISEDNLRIQCHRFCAAKNYSYFALEKDERWQPWPPRLLYFWFCSCGHHFNSGTVNQSCVECDKSSEDHGWCGLKGESKAVYSIHAMGLFNKWGRNEPKGMNDVRCLVFDTYTIEWISQPCNFPYDQGLCVRDGPYCNWYEYMGQLSGKCFRVQKGGDVAQREAAEACQNQGMSLVSASNYRIHEDAMVIWSQEGKKGIPLWTSGTHLRWVWITDEEVGVNGQYVGWADKEEFAFENMCLALNSSGIWSSQGCSGYKAHICETVVDDQEVIQRQTTIAHTFISESRRSAILETTVRQKTILPTFISESRRSAILETTVSTSETRVRTGEASSDQPMTKGATATTCVPYPTIKSPPGGTDQAPVALGLIVGGGLGGFIAVVLIIVALLLFLRKRRTGKEATTNQPMEIDVHAYDYIHAESRAQICQQDIGSVAKANGDYSELSQTRPSHDYVALKTNCNEEGKVHQTTEYIQLNNDRFQHEYAALNAQQNKLNHDKIQTEYSGLHANRNSLYQK